MPRRRNLHKILLSSLSLMRLQLKAMQTMFQIFATLAQECPEEDRTERRDPMTALPLHTTLPRVHGFRRKTPGPFTSWTYQVVLEKLESIERTLDEIQVIGAQSSAGGEESNGTA